MTIATFKKSVLGRAIAESLDDFVHGRTYGPFPTAREAVASMKKELARYRRLHCEAGLKSRAG